VLFGQSSCRVKEKLVRVLLSLFINLQYSSALIVPLLLRPSSDHNSLCISSLAVAKSLEITLESESKTATKSRI